MSNSYDPNSANRSPERRGAPGLIVGRTEQLNVATMLLLAATKGLTKVIEEKTPVLPPDAFTPKYSPINPDNSETVMLSPAPKAEPKPMLPTGFKPSSNVVEMHPRQTETPTATVFPMTEQEIMVDAAQKDIEKLFGGNTTPVSIERLQAEERLKQNSNDFGLAA